MQFYLDNTYNMQDYLITIDPSISICFVV